jgi:hypothetical protein
MQNAPTPPLSALGGLAWRFGSDASVHDMSVTLLRNHSPPNDASPNFTARNGVGVGEDAAKLDGWFRCHGCESLFVRALCVAVY